MEAFREQVQDGDCEKAEQLGEVIGQDPRGRDVIVLRKPKRRAANKAARQSRKKNRP